MAGNDSSRRSFVKFLAAAPLLSQIAARDLYAHAATAMGVGGKQNVYSRLGVKTVINCRGTWTYLSGSLEFPEVRQAQLEASEYFVEHAGTSTRRRPPLVGVDWRRVGHCDLGLRWSHGRSIGCLHGRYGRQTDLAASRYHRVET